jgi:hypothetical protein
VGAAAKSAAAAVARCAAARAAAATVADDDDDDDDDEPALFEGVLALADSRAAPARDVSAAWPSSESNTRPTLGNNGAEDEEEDADAAPKAGERCGEIGVE